MEETTNTNAPAAVTQMPEKNGVREPRPGTNCALIWALATSMSNEINAPVAVGDLIAKGTEQGFNEATIKTQYARWRKYHGIEGRVESQKAREKREAAAAAKAAKEAEKLAKKQAREDEKARKAKEKAEAKAKREEEKKRKAEEKAAAEAEKAAEAAAAKAAKDAASEAGEGSAE